MGRRIGIAVLLLVMAACSNGGVLSSQSAAPKPEINADADRAMQTAADATREAGRYAEALEIYQRILLKSPKSSAAQYGAGECMLALRKPKDAKEIFAPLLIDREYHARAMQGTGLSLLMLSEREPAEKALREATKSDVSLWRAWNGLGELADLKKKPKEAMTFYEHALAIKPNSTIIMNNIGYSELMSGNVDRSVAELRKALELDPNNAVIRINLGLAIASSGDYAQALRVAPPDGKAQALNNIGYIASRRGDYRAAEGYLTRAMETSSSYDSIAATNLEFVKAHEELKQ